MKNKFCVDMPYPEVVIDRPTQNDARCIKESYSGAEGELTAIMQYMYQAYVLGVCDEEMHKEIEHIAIVEMKHHEMLGETLVKLNCKPILSGNCCMWNANAVDYCDNPILFLQNNIEAEKRAIRNYKIAIDCVCNYSIKELLERIIMDEELHIVAFKEMLEKVRASRKKREDC